MTSSRDEPARLTPLDIESDDVEPPQNVSADETHKAVPNSPPIRLHDDVSHATSLKSTKTSGVFQVSAPL